MNQSDSERISHVIENMGYRRAANEEDADLLGILSCSVRQKSIDKVYSRIAKWNKWKGRKNLLTFVSGCVLPADKEKFLKLFDIVFQPSEIKQLPEMLSQYGVVSSYSLEQLYPGLEKREIFDFWQVDPDYQSAFYAYVPIQNGCDKFCSFCAVPYTRGREVSRASDEIVGEIEQLIRNGYKSITLLGQNVNSYGLDKKGEEISFAELLRKIGKVADDSGRECWVYFTSPHPRDMTDEVIEVISQYKSLAKQIHLPIQSGDERVLMRMKRNHSVEKYRSIVDSIHKLIPEATLFTDIIVGFTGESDEQFENTRKVMEEFKYNMAYIAKYSPRPGALSARWEDNIGHETKKKRLELLTEELKKHSLDYNKTLVGKTLRLLVYGADKKQGYLTGLTEGKLTVRFPSTEYGLKGSFVDVKIVSVTPFAMEGLLVSEDKRKEENTVSYEAEHRV